MANAETDFWDELLRSWATLPRPQQTPSEWIAKIFRAQQARHGGVVRRHVSDVHKYASLAQLEAEVKGRGFHMVQTGDQYVILCHAGEFRVIC